MKIIYNYDSYAFKYDSYVRLTGYNKDGFQPTLKCNGTIMDDWDDDETNPTPMYVGAITADEVVFAGGKVYENNPNFYLINKKLRYSYFWALSPSDFIASGIDFAFRVDHSGVLRGYGLSDDYSFRPSVSLASSAVISSGEGTLEKPYVIG